MEIKINNSNENPFYGMSNCLRLFQSVGSVPTIELLDNCYKEANTKERKEMLFSLLFSVGDITSRQHNIFKKVKRDNGGNANREGFAVILDWMWSKHKDQFIKFLNAGLFNEYTCFDVLFRNRVQTKGKRINRILNRLAEAEYRNVLAEYLYKVIKGTNPFNKMLVAKFLSLPRVTKRAGHKRMLPETKKVMEDKVKLLIQLSNLMGWEYEVNECYANFKGYRTWRKDYNADLESVLFSTGKIREFDENSFLEWYNIIPSQARFRVKNRILYSTVGDTKTLKWNKFVPWIEAWEKFKEQKQAEQRVLEEKVRQGQASTEDKARLEKVKKEAKVTVGATNFNEIYKQICSGTIDKLALETFINKVNLPYNSLVIIDDSGSMSGEPFNFATFMASVCLVKNPDDDARNLVGLFNSRSHWHSYIDSRAGYSPNSIIRRGSNVKTETSPLVDPTKSFIDNYKKLHNFLASVFQGGMTNVSAIPDGLKKACDENPGMYDALKSYPVWTIISDCDFNNLPNPTASMNDFMMKCERYFGFKPFVVAIAIKSTRHSGYWSEGRAELFTGIENFIYIPSNPAQIEQFLTNFKDLDIFDVYTPLQSIFRSNRYDLIRQNTL